MNKHLNELPGDQAMELAPFLGGIHPSMQRLPTREDLIVRELPGDQQHEIAAYLGAEIQPSVFGDEAEEAVETTLAQGAQGITGDLKKILAA